MQNSQRLISFLVIFLVTEQPDGLLAILAGQQQDSSAQNVTANPNHLANLTISEPQSDPPNKLDSNSTFYYDADAYLIGGKQQQAKNVSTDHSAAEKKDNTSSESKQIAPPADARSTSARSGRMMDLDALMGDFSSSRANKERQMSSGNRQSRFLSQSSHMDIAGGKRLHIQGFIPIVGIKDDDAAEDEAAEQGVEHLHASATRQRPKVSNNIELPYGQSSIGHASFGVQRYLNSDDQTIRQQQLADYQQVAPKFSGAPSAASSSMIDSLKKPIKKLANLASGNKPLATNEISLNRIGSQPQQQQNDCLCVPFYMCKSGFISEASLGKSQIQQLLQQQQQQQQQLAQQPRQIDPSDSIRRGSVVPAPVRPQQQKAFAPEQYPLIDERSFEREIVTAPPISSEGGGAYANETLGMLSDSFLAMENALATTTTSTTTTQAPPPTSDQVATDLDIKQNVTIDQQQSADQASDYSQEILGRMLGLKSSPGAKFSLLGGGGGDAQPQQQAGVCGLLRTCCTIQYDSSNNRKSFAQIYQNNNVRQQAMQLFQPQQTVPEILAANQRYQQQLPYGSPAAQQISQRMQPVNTYPDQHSNSLAHRSNQYTSQPLQSQAISQYTRAAPQMQPLQTFQPQSSFNQQAPPMMKSWPAAQNQLGLNAAATANQLQTMYNQQLGGGVLPPMNSNLGTRKLLDGRCGLRQSTGITGRVQNLQYHENSADFGEYPAQAAILKRLNGTESLFVCGGTLISQHWIATAAHCIRKHSQGDLKVRLGEWDVNRDDEFYPYVEKDIRDVVVHPDFLAGNLINDIALLRLSSPVDSSLPHVNPACLPTVDETFTRQRCWVTGWGKDSFGQRGSFQSVLSEVELPVAGHAECEQALRQTRLGPHYRLHSGFICAGGEGGKDACEGDGGSGLYCYQDGLLKVAGLVSWGIGCGQQGVPGVYVNLAHYRPWIENIISIDEDVYSKSSAPVTTTVPPSPN